VQSAVSYQSGQKCEFVRCKTWHFRAKFPRHAIIEIDVFFSQTKSLGYLNVARVLIAIESQRYDLKNISVSASGEIVNSTTELICNDPKSDGPMKQKAARIGKRRQS
jgi:hypothetical protein